MHEYLIMGRMEQDDMKYKTELNYHTIEYIVG